jgi:hypothetical protein
MVVPLIGYVDRFSGRPGERLAIKVSSKFDAPYRADMVRIVHADANPAGPGIKIEEVAAAFAGEYPSRSQPIEAALVRVAGGRVGRPVALPPDRLAAQLARRRFRRYARRPSSGHISAMAMPLSPATA